MSMYLDVDINEENWKLWPYLDRTPINYISNINMDLDLYMAFQQILISLPLLNEFYSMPYLNMDLDMIWYDFEIYNWN